MSQVTIYLPPDVEQLVRRAARRSRQSVSAWFAELARREVKPTRWPEGYFQRFARRSPDPIEVPPELASDEPEPIG
ncbi:MAG: hypothetical protein IT380_11340 [Myxococcales bacterium]|nr:hypothetical protein [Myxococcales bacterium]